ncbi:S1 family peptidase [Actinoallomurus purpureus]|uniref:S1 family peptidase n=1 Tax=Actinoallomurus purpureus TaxID=478114 RepID=UPI0020935EEF|nr:S1 family peptidase [Actinoallomurus purpureus]MCO6009839.1 S1 family peptidase [Actinoallomurus purpureus]
MRFATPLAFCALLTVAWASPAYAITNGTDDGNDHPSVGALLSDKPYDDGTFAYCTGTLISPTVFLTAAHCGHHRQKTAQVTFSSHYRHGDAVYTGRYIPDERYSSKEDAYDMAVVVFNAPVAGIKPARLPAAGFLSHLRAEGTLPNTKFTPVGYGSLNPSKGAHKTKFVYTDTRSRTTISYDGLSHMWLKLSLNRGDGGTCYGDSGGPNFLGNSDLLVATTISGDDDDCKATNYDYRLDSAPARKFLARFVTLP